jgi:glycosyltransferase 2 family protein
MIKNWKIWVKAIVSLILLGILLNSVELGEISTILSGCDLIYAFIAWSLIMLFILYSAVKLRFILVSAGEAISLKPAIYSCFVAQAFNQVLPGRVGGDVIKIFYLAKFALINKVDILSAVVVDRFSNLVALLIIGCIFSPFYFKGQYQWLIYLLWTGTGVLFFLILFHQYILDRLVGWFGSRIVKENEFLKQIIRLTYTAKKSLDFIFLGIIFQVVVILVNYLVGCSIGLSIPLGYYFAFIPLLMLVTLVPVSLGGLGVRELTYVYFLSLQEVTTADALSLSILLFGLLLISSIPGLLLFTVGTEKYVEISRS